jgi:hypothetical protein
LASSLPLFSVALELLLVPIRLARQQDRAVVGDLHPFGQPLSAAALAQFIGDVVIFDFLFVRVAARQMLKRTTCEHTKVNTEK